METRVGIGFDSHCFTEERKLFLGGIQIPYSKGLAGHSDADCLLHAITDALLGAIAQGDIGELFPDTDPKYKDISSAEILKEVLVMIYKKGYALCNVDTVIIAEEPKMGPFKNKIKENLSKILNITEDCIAVKAKTNEGMGSLGRKEGIAAYAVVLIKKEG